MNKEHFKSAVAFGDVLLRTGDLDPVYIALTALPEVQRVRAVMAYSCLYHLGVAGYLSEFEGEEFWDKLGEAARNRDGGWPRGTERRHWRGDAATSCVNWFMMNYEKPEQVVYRWYNGAESSKFEDVAREIRKTPQYGPWIAFKVADMMERVLKMSVDFSDCALGFYREPLAGAALLFTGDKDSTISTSELNFVVKEMLKKLGHVTAPPWKDRPINVQEVETILCKYKSHCGGHYELGKDTLEVYHGLSTGRWYGKASARMIKKLQPHYEHWRKLEAKR